MKVIKYILRSFLIIFILNSCQQDEFSVDDMLQRKFVRITKPYISLNVGEKMFLHAVTDSLGSSTKTFTWTVLNDQIASIETLDNTLSAIITGVGEGNTVVMIESTDRKLKYFADLSVSGEKVIKILSVGDGTSEDATENYFYDLAKADGYKVIIANMYVDGSSLQNHWENASTRNAIYQQRIINTDGSRTTINNVDLVSAIKNENWDFIVFQEAGHLAGKKEGYQEYLPKLVELTRSLATNPDLKIALHQTWAYAQNATQEEFSIYDRDQMNMYHAICDAVGEAATDSGVDIVIPTGTAIQNGRTSYLGDRFTRDGYHLDLGVGRFTAAATWYEAIFGGVLDNTYYPENLLKYDTDLAKNSAYYAVKESFMVTELVEYKERGPNEFVLNDPIFIDFGPILSPEPYNNFKRWQDGSISNLKDEKGNNSGFILKAGIPFHEGVIERNMPNLLGFPLTASQDAFFNDGLVAPEGSSLILSNLNTNQTYSFVLYATINDKGTQTEYRVIGKNQGSGILDTDHNLSKNVIINDIEPDENGEITIVVKKGPDATQYWGYYGLNTMIILPGGTTYDFPENNYQLENPVFVDFGLWLSGYPFNNLKDPWDPRSDLANPVLNMIDNEGNNTGFALAITDGFSAVNDLGAWGNRLGLPDEVAVDAFWGDKWMPDGQLTLSNLNKAEKYDLVFYGSRRDVSDNRETVYEVKGSNSGSASLNVSGNNGDVAIITGIAPDVDGNIIILIKAGPNNNTPELYYCLNAMFIGPEGFYNAGVK